MSGFISKAACKGRRPSQFVGFNGFQRQDLITHLLKERGVARFVVAPSGYGKTSVVLEYAETVFAWVHTFFVNCQSPCFIRDLDEGSIARDCLDVDPGARLVVFDALPPLDADRAKQFSDEIDTLLAAHCEVIVTCTPAGDVLGYLQGDQVRLPASELLLSDDELEATCALDNRANRSTALLSAAHRVPALAWDDSLSAVSSFLKKSFQEPMPTDFLLAMASMYVLHQGSLESLSAFGPLDFESIGSLLEAYPHLCFDVDLNRFDAPLASIDSIALALKGRFGEIVERSAFGTRKGLVMAWADALLKGGDVTRACDVVRVICPQSARRAWTANRAEELVRRGCFYPSLQLIKAAAPKGSDVSQAQNANVVTLESIARLALGDDQGALTRAKRITPSSEATDWAKVHCALVVSRWGNGTAKRQADAYLEELGEACGSNEPHGASPEEALGCAWRAAQGGVGMLADEWAVLFGAGVDDVVLGLVAKWLFDLLDEQFGENGPTSFSDMGTNVSAAERFVRERLESAGAEAVDFATLSAALSMERIHMKGVAYSAGPLPTKILLDMRQAELGLLQQKQRFDSDAANGSSEGDARSRLRRVPASSNAESQFAASMPRNVPVLQLKMFGKFEASIGGVSLDQSLFCRQNVRSLLVLLAINQGRELPRETVMNAMWPKSSERVARKNYYAVWSQLKRALSLSDGTCPYLVRHQYGCRLEERYVQSDVARLGQICRELLFGRPDFQEWSAIYAELDQDFANDLLPAETSNPLVARARSDYRARLVDALVAASQAIVEAGNPQWGIWYVRMALSHDETREDAYVALMRAQIAGNQRTAAIMTFLKCQRVLAEELGVDPSAETVALYESLLE